MVNDLIVILSTGSPQGGATSPPSEKLKLLETFPENKLVMLTIFVARLPEQPN